jgi:DNA-binding CsgD family transcriptional regulator
VLQLATEGLERQVIAERLGIHVYTVWVVRVRNGRPTGPSGKSLATARVQEIQRRRARGDSIRRIARLVGCTTDTVLKYLYIARGMEQARRRSR